MNHAKCNHLGLIKDWRYIAQVQSPQISSELKKLKLFVYALRVIDVCACDVPPMDTVRNMRITRYTILPPVMRTA